MSYRETLDKINAQKRARIRARKINEVKQVVLTPVKENAGVVIGATTLIAVGCAGISTISVYAEDSSVVTEETTQIYVRDAVVPQKVVVDVEKTDMNRTLTAGVSREISKTCVETKNTRDTVIRKALYTSLVEKAISTKEYTKEEKSKVVVEEKKELTEEEKREILWNKEKEYCLEQEKNVYDNWRTNRGNGVSNSSTRTHMSYTAVTSVSSMQYRILRSNRAWNSKYTGLRMYDDRYCVAVGTKYGKAGDKIDLVMEDGSVVKAIIGDIKSDRDTDETHMFQKDDGSIVELITDGSPYDREKVPKVLRQHIKTIVNVEGINFE